MSVSASELPLPHGQPWWFPRIDLVDAGRLRISSSLKEDWFGPHPYLCPLLPRKHRFRKLASSEHGISWPRDMLLLLERRSGVPRLVHNEDSAHWAAFRTPQPDSSSMRDFASFRQSTISRVSTKR